MSTVGIKSSAATSPEQRFAGVGGIAAAQRDLHVAEAREDRLAIGLHQLELPAQRQLELPFQQEAVEQRLGDPALLDQIGELARAEAAPPIERRWRSHP
jgi:hypothetical protein